MSPSHLYVLLFYLDPPCTMLRLDAASLAAPPPTSAPADLPFSNQSTPQSPDYSSLSHTATVNLHGLLVDNLCLQEASSMPFQCSSVSNLVQGAGVGFMDTFSLGYDHQIQVNCLVEVIEDTSCFIGCTLWLF